MSTTQLVRRLVDAGFVFTLTNGEVQFRRPDGDSPEIDELAGAIAWRWAGLEQAVREHLITTNYESKP